MTAFGNFDIQSKHSNVRVIGGPPPPPTISTENLTSTRCTLDTAILYFYLSMARLLVVDDLADSRQPLRDLLVAEGHEVDEAAGVPEAVGLIRALPFDLVLSDVRMEAEDDGLTLLRTIKREVPELPIILYSGYTTLPNALLAGRLGASDYLELPVNPDLILTSVAAALDPVRRAGSLPVTRELATAFQNIVAESDAMRAVLGWVKQVGPKDVSVVLTGETGTGKELIAQAIHALSKRRAKMFVPVNCSAIPEGLFEAELFGVRRGAFTGATTDRRGLLEEADGGTLFLDEIGELPLLLQARLLRVLESGELKRLGENRTRSVDIRVIAATNRRLQEEVKATRFRPDLYYRLNVSNYHLPPLRDRLDDLDALIRFWIPRLTDKLNVKIRDVSPNSIELLRRHRWPGNVRELRNVLEHALCLVTDDRLTEREIAVALNFGRTENVISGDCATSEREQLLTILEQFHWHIERAAHSLGISRCTLWRRLKRLGIHK